MQQLESLIVTSPAPPRPARPGRGLPLIRTAAMVFAMQCLAGSFEPVDSHSVGLTTTTTTVKTVAAAGHRPSVFGGLGQAL
ncbi:MAG: hypothetical protein ACYTGR_08910 [Planctomycetota bacterium]